MFFPDITAMNLIFSNARRSSPLSSAAMRRSFLALYTQPIFGFNHADDAKSQ
jgi:hypothetical protein